jgi:prepilin-type N-terminal cleavage/methylation domain-containing protein
MTSSPQQGLISLKFSLVELLVVVAILSILMSLLTPSLKNAIKHSLSLHCSNNLKNLATAVAVYVDHHDQRFPTNGGPLYEGEHRAWSWDDQLSEFDGRNILSESQKDQEWLKEGGKEQQMYLCPNDSVERASATMIPRSYVPNWIRNENKEFYGPLSKDRVGRGILTMPESKKINAKSYAMQISSIPFPSKSIGWLEHQTAHNSMGFFKNNQGAIDAYGLLRRWNSNVTQDQNIHGEFQSNYLLLDMSVKSIWYPDTLEVLHGASNGDGTRDPSVSPWDVKGSSEATSVLGTLWDCW